MAWSSWQEAAGTAVRLAALLSALVAIAVGLSCAWLALTLVDGASAIAAIVYAALVAALTRFAARELVRRLRFARTAREMRNMVVPTLLSFPSPAGLLHLAHAGGAVFTKDSAVVRAEPRDAAVYLVATQYDTSKIGWDDAGGAFLASG